MKDKAELPFRALRQAKPYASNERHTIQQLVLDICALRGLNGLAEKNSNVGTDSRSPGPTRLRSAVIHIWMVPVSGSAWQAKPGLGLFAMVGSSQFQRISPPRHRPAELFPLCVEAYLDEAPNGFR